MLSSKKELEFTVAFTSPKFGNVYIGKKVTLPAKEADVFIAHKVAVEIGSEEHKALLAAVPATSKPPVTQPSDPYEGMTAKEKKAAMLADAKAKDIEAKKARLAELMNKAGLSDEEAGEADGLEMELKGK